MNNAKIWVLITGIVVIVSGFLLYSMIRSRETEKSQFIVKIQELTGRVAELDRTRSELDQVKKEKAQAEAKYQDEISSLESQVADMKKSQSLWKSKIETMTREKESLTKYMENNNSIIAKLNKKIEALEKERDNALEQAKKISEESYVNFVDPMKETTSSDASDEKMAPAAGAKLAEEEIVDLGRIILHPSTNQAARVEHVNPLYGFIVISAGTNDGLRKDSVINISRNNRLIAKAVIKKAREDVSSAVTLPEWTREEIKVGDLVSVNWPSPADAG